jgi:hypothetical protein
MDWDLVWIELNGCFRRVQAAVDARLPGLGGRIARGPGFADSVFDAYLSFAHLPLEASVEDVVIQFACGPVARGGFSTDDGQPLFTKSPERHALQFEIMRGSGKTLARLQPALLPATIGSSDYDRQVGEFLAQSMSLLETSIPLIVQNLAPSAGTSP